jgi:hypothetical protein
MAESNITSTGNSPGLDSGVNQNRGLQWNPTPDITAFEVALALPLIAAAMARRTLDTELAARVLQLPENVRRHFRAS